MGWGRFGIGPGGGRGLGAQPTIFVGLDPDVAFSRPWPALTGRSGSRYADAMARRDLIAEKLTKAFAPASLEVVDESHQHAGHAGHREGGETHFRVDIVAGAGRGKRGVHRHRAHKT